MHSNSARFRYHGTGGALLGLTVTNALLSMLTLGIYSFWARTKVRRFHHEHTEMDGDRFTYHGTGGELLRGALRAFGAMLLLALIVGVAVALIPGAAPRAGGEPGPAFVLSVYAIVGLLATAAVNLTRRYRFSRASWRGIRFSFHGKTGDYVKLMLRGTLLSIVTLGFYTPHFQNQRRAFLVDNARFGSERFMYDGSGRALFGDYVKALLLTIPTLGLVWVWYAAAKHRHFWTHTRMQGARFVSTVTGGDLFKLHVTNGLLVLFTLGIATPWAVTRMHAYFCDNLRLMGTVEWATIEQRAHAANAMGEGIADNLDMEVDIGL